MSLAALSTVLGALALDRALGEPPNRWHPVAWFGLALAPLSRWLPTLSPRTARVAGTLAWAAAVGGVALLAWALQAVLAQAPAWLAWPLGALALKPALAWRMLKREVAAVEAALVQGLDEGRQRLAGLCSRDVRTLDEAGVRETAIETLAENLNDAFVAPLFWWAVAGLPGAWAWRAVNTLDAMWGYRGRWTHAGACAARADDVLAWLPARLTALLLWRPGLGWARLRTEAARTPSPNGGWPMAAMALGLGVRLGKPGVYVLNAGGRPPTPADLARALRRAEAAACAASVLALALAAAGVPGFLFTGAAV